MSLPQTRGALAAAARAEAAPGQGMEPTDSLLEVEETQSFRWEEAKQRRASAECGPQQHPAEPSRDGKGKGVGEVYTGFNIGKAVVGAGSFALPWAFKNEGVLGGSITILISAILAVHTMKMLIRMKDLVERQSGKTNLSYVDVARHALGNYGAYFVFGTQFCASMGVCSAYFAFIGSTLVGLCAQDGTWMNAHMSDWTKLGFQHVMMAVLLPVTFLRSFRFLRFTSTVGTVAVFLALVATMVDGFNHEDSTDALWQKIQVMPLWPDQFGDYAKSFGCITFLFCTNFLILPIERGMKRPENFSITLDTTFVPITTINLLFAGICFAFYGDDTEDIVTNNLGGGAFITMIKLLLCVDLLLTYPLVFCSGREIVERIWMKDEDVILKVSTFSRVVSEGRQLGFESDCETDMEDNASVRSFAPSLRGGGDDTDTERGGMAFSPYPGAGLGAPRELPPPRKKKKPLFAKGKQMLIRTVLVFLSFTFAQAKGFGLITNVVGGFAQGSLAFVIPPAIELQLCHDTLTPFEVLKNVVLIGVGVLTAILTSAEAVLQSGAP